MHHYSLSPWFVTEWFVSLPLVRHRSFAADANRALRPYRQPRVEGAEHVPRHGPSLVVANHYERKGMGAWWTGMAITSALHERRPDIAMRWMHTNRFGRYRIFGHIRVPEAPMGWLLRQVARRYGFLLVTRDKVGPRAPMLREAYRSLHRDGQSVAVMPEAGNAGENGVLGQAWDGAGAALAWLSAGSVPLLPVAAYTDDSGDLVVRFGPTFALPREREGNGNLTTEAMSRVAELLPCELRGYYAEAVR